LRALLAALKLEGRELSSQDVAIRFAPKLNALSRMESEILPIQIYLENDKHRANQMIHKVLENNETRQSLQGDAEQRALELLKDWTNKDFVFVSSPFFHRGVIGLIATKLSQIFNRPAFVGSENSEGVIVGSSRLASSSEQSLVEALRFAEKSLNRHGGHAAAAGFELHAKELNQFVALLAEYFLNAKQAPRPIELNFDTTASIDEIDISTMKWHEFLGPYGVGFNVPIICLPEVELISKKEIKGGHLKLIFSQSNINSQIEALFFSPPAHCRLDNLSGIKFSVLGELQWNYFAGKKSIQLLVKDLKQL
jgi:single-stranded-DNA-specific exonuclease